MRAPVYRNLDQPFSIFGLRPSELVAICVLFVVTGEVSEFFGWGRGWAFFLSILLTFGIFSFRRYLGDHFAARFLRFLKLPSYLYPHLLEPPPMNKLNRRDG